MNNETQSSRYSVGNKVLSVALTAALSFTTFAGLGTVTSTNVTVDAANDYGLADSIQEGTILHCFDWKYKDITEELPNIAAAGFTSIQTSPAQMPAGSDKWYWLYQPLGFYVPDSQPLGTKEELRTLCSEAEKYGIFVVVDIVANHLAGDHSNIQNDLKDSQYWHNESGGIDYSNRWQITHRDLGMPDINSENSYVQQVVKNYILELKGLGVDGLRFDAAKHISLPSEGCDFWSNIQVPGMYYYGEILDSPGGGNGDSLMKEYTNYMSVTDNKYGETLLNSFAGGNATQSIGNWSERGVSKDRLVYWGESHDTYSNDGEYGSNTAYNSQNQVDRAYAVAAAQGKATSLYFSRPAATRKDSILIGQKGSTHFTSPEVAAVNHFHNAMNGTKEYYTTGSNCSVVCREGGAVIVAGSGGNFEVTVPNGGGIVAAGTYTDEVSGSQWTVTGTTISGKIGDSGIAVIYNAKPVVKGGVSASPATGTTFEGTLTVTLNASEVTGATYKTSEGDSGAYTDGKTITIGASTADNASVTLTLSGTKSDGSTATATYTYKKVPPKEYPTLKGSGFVFDNSTSNWSTVNAYVYDESGTSVVTNGAWPGVKMTDCGNGYWSYELDSKFTSSSSVQVIFTNGSDQIPGAQQPGYQMKGTEKKLYEGGTWKDLPEKQDPTPTGPFVTFDKADGTSFTTETLDVKLTLNNATKGTYSVDGGPVKEFTGSATATLGQGKIGNSTVKLDVTATDGTTTKKYSYSYEKKYVVKTTSSSAGLASQYKTNPTGVGKEKTITIDGDASDWSDDLLIAQGAAWDVANHWKGGHENCVLDTYALYAAWDDTNLYVGWQMVNTTDTWAREGDGPLSDGGRVLDVPLILALSINPSSTSMSNKNTTGGPIWGKQMGLEFNTHVDRLLYMSGKPGLGKPSMFKAVDAQGNTDYEEGAVSFLDGGIEYAMAETNICSSIIGLNNSDSPKDVSDNSADWVDYKTFAGSAGTHNTKYDSFYEIKIPLKTLGISKEYLTKNGIGAMLVATRGESALDCIPFDLSMVDNATGDYATDPSTSAEKDDIDIITASLARIGNGTINPDPDPDPDPDPSVPLQVNFGANLSAPQYAGTALTLKAEGYGGTAPYTYQFYVDGTSVKANNSTASSAWSPKAGTHTIKCVITDSTGKTATVEKKFTAESNGGDDDDDDLVNNSTISATTIDLGKSLTLKGAASGGSGGYTYAVFYKQTSQTSWTTVQSYASSITKTITPKAATTYTVRVKVKDSKGNIANKDFKVTVTKALTNNSTISATSITLGQSLTLKGAATGGTSPYTYAVYYKQKSQTNWTAVQGYASTITKTITPKAATTYTVRVKAKDKNGTIANKDFTVTVKKAALTNNSTISATSITLGQSLTLKGAATGGTGSYTYAVFYKKTSSSTWTTVQSYASSITKKITPLNATTYNVRVKVKDSAGTITNKDFKVTVKYAALVNNSTISATSIDLGTSLTLKGAATGGSGTYTYAVYYKKTSQTDWTKVQDYASTISKKVTPLAATTYTVRVKAKDSAGTITNKDFKVTVKKAALVNTSTISATTLDLGKSLTLKGSATGGTTKYTYAVYYKKTSDTSWTKVQDYASSITKTVTPKAATTYTVRVKVKDSAGTIANKDFTVTVKVPLTNNSTLSATSITLGKTVTVKASATGGSGYYNYAVFYKKASSSSWTTVQSYKAENSITIKPQAVTTYDVCVKVKDSNNTEVKKYFTVNVAAAPLTNTSTISSTSIVLGDTLTLKGAATGGTSPYTYAVYYKKTSDTSWTAVQSTYASTISKKVTPKAATTYTVRVKVKDAKGTIANKDFKVTVGKALSATAKASATSVSKGSSVTITGVGSGGTGGYTYEISYLKFGSSSWTTAKAYSTTASKAITFSTAGQYSVKVNVKDSSGTVATAYVAVTVS